MSTLAEILAPSSLPECRSKLAGTIVSIPISPPSSESGLDEIKNDEDLPLVLLTFALHIDAPRGAEAQTHSVPFPLPFPCSYPSEDMHNPTEIPDSKHRDPRADGSRRQGPLSSRAAAQNKPKPVRNINVNTRAPQAFPSREPFAECGNQCRVEVGKLKLKLKTRHSYAGDEKENIPPLRRVSFSLDV